MMSYELSRFKLSHKDDHMKLRNDLYKEHAGWNSLLQSLIIRQSSKAKTISLVIENKGLLESLEEEATRLQLDISHQED